MQLNFRVSQALEIWGFHEILTNFIWQIKFLKFYVVLVDSRLPSEDVVICSLDHANSVSELNFAYFDDK